jgi:hypothetical protein
LAQKKPDEPAFLLIVCDQLLTLASLEARVGFVDHIDTTLAAHYAAILITLFGGFQRA